MSTQACDDTTTVPATIPAWLVDEVVAALPEPEDAEQIWWWRPGCLEYAVLGRDWLRRQIGLVLPDSFGAVRNGLTGAFGQVVRIGGGFAVEVGFSAEWPDQVSVDGGLPDGSSVAALTEVVRGNGAPAAVRTGRRWRLGAVAAAEVAWTWVSESRLPGGYASRPAL